MKDTIPSTLPDGHALRLGGCHQEFLENLGSLGPLFIQARNRGGGLGKRANSIHPLIIPTQTYAVDPDLGLALSLDEFIGVHANVSPLEEHLSPSLDLEFSSFPAGLSLMEIPGISTPDSIANYTRQYGGIPISPDSLEDWRNEISPPHTICDCCAKAALHRAKHPQGHPLFSIFTHAWQSGVSLTVRLIGNHVDLITSLSPANVYPVSGFIVVGDSEGESVLHLNLEMVHAFQMITQQIDGHIHSSIRVFDMYGNQNFEITAEGAEILPLWREIADQSDSEYQIQGY